MHVLLKDYPIPQINNPRTERKTETVTYFLCDNPNNSEPSRNDEEGY